MNGSDIGGSQIKRTSAAQSMNGAEQQHKKIASEKAQRQHERATSNAQEISISSFVKMIREEKPNEAKFPLIVGNHNF